MKVIRGTGTALRSVVEEHPFWIGVNQSVKDTVALFYQLQLMLAGGNGEMYWQYGERIDKNIKVLVEMPYHLHGRTIATT